VRRRRRGPIEEIRRALAAIGADVGAHGVDGPLPEVRALVLPGAEAAVRRIGPPEITARAVDPPPAETHAARPPDVGVRNASLGALRPEAAVVGPLDPPGVAAAPAIPPSRRLGRDADRPARRARGHEGASPAATGAVPVPAARAGTDGAGRSRSLRPARPAPSAVLPAAVPVQSPRR
jgi:hypothetical protein